MTPINAMAPSHFSKTPNVHFRFLIIKKKNFWRAAGAPVKVLWDNHSRGAEKKERCSEGKKGRRRERKKEGRREGVKQEYESQGGRGAEGKRRKRKRARTKEKEKEREMERGSREWIC